MYRELILIAKKESCLISSGIASNIKLPEDGLVFEIDTLRTGWQVSLIVTAKITWDTFLSANEAKNALNIERKDGYMKSKIDFLRI